MEAVILAGGLGTRLRSVVSDVPKPMAAIGDRPFLARLIHHISSYGVTRAILATGYKSDVIYDYFGRFYDGVDILYSQEDSPLGTGGALQQAFGRVNGDYVIVLNGDTFVDTDLRQLAAEHVSLGVDITMTLCMTEDASRYGTVQVDQERVTGFSERGRATSGLINAGVYAVNVNLFANRTHVEPFSFEQYLQENISTLSVAPYFSNGYFIDIGVPDDYQRAKVELLRHGS